MWGGAADQPFDPNYHKDTDTLDHIDKAALGINGDGVAYAVGLYAQDRPAATEFRFAKTGPATRCRSSRAVRQSPGRQIGAP